MADAVTVAAEELRAFATAMFERVGVPKADAGLVADTLVEADLRGVNSHGVVRIPPYVARLRAGGLNKVTEVAVVRERPATVLLDGNNGIGQVIAVRAMQTAIERARTAGFGLVGVRNSNHFGAIKIEAFLPTGEFKARVDEYVRRVHSAERAAGVDRIYVPGELEWLTKQERERNGIPLPAATVAELRTLADELGVPLVAT